MDDGVGRKTAALQAFGIDAIRLRGIARRGDKRRYVLQHHSAYRGNAVRADVAKLVHGSKPAEYRVVVDLHVAG